MLITFLVIQLGLATIYGLVSFVIWINIFPEYMKNFGETFRISLLLSVLIGGAYRKSVNSTDDK